jgi:hypothetical protein
MKLPREPFQDLSESALREALAILLQALSSPSLFRVHVFVSARLIFPSAITRSPTIDLF